MKVYVYKGFDFDFLSNIKYNPLVNSDINQKIDYLKIDDKKIAMDIISKADDDGEYWMTYEEYQIGLNVINFIPEREIIILKNNVYPDIYPIYSNVSEELYKEYVDNVDESTKATDVSSDFKRFKVFYNSMDKIDNLFYVTYYNDEYNNYKIEDVRNFYPNTLTVRSIEEGQNVNF